MSLTDQRVFVTGASGFVGAHVVRALCAEGAAVSALVRDPRRAAHLSALPGVALLPGDLTAPPTWRPSLAGHDACVHLALLWGDAADDLALADLRASAALFEAAAEAGVARFVYTSSAAVHRPWAPSMRASDPLRCADYYGATKASGEAFLSAVCHQHPMRGNVLRPGAVVGGPALPGAPVRIDRRIAAMIEAARRGDTLRVVRGEGRQFIGARELARLYVALLTRDAAHERFVAVAPEVIRWEEVAAEVVAHVGAGRVAVEEGDVAPAAFDVSDTERRLGPIASARGELREALRALCGATGSPRHPMP